MNCRHCQAPLAVASPAPSRCASCGSWTGTGEGTSTTVSVDRGIEQLTITMAWWARADLGVWARLLYLLAFGSFLAVATRFAILTLESYAALVPLTLFGYLPALAVSLGLLQRVRNRSTLLATRDGITVRWGPHGSGERKVSLDGGVQFYSVDDRGRASVRLMREGGESALLVRQAEPLAALQIERVLEGFYGWTDQPVPGELPKAAAFAARSTSSRIRYALHAVAASALVVLFGYLMTLPAVSGRVAEVDLPADGASRSVTLSLPEPRNLEVWVRFEMTFEGTLGRRESPFRKLPRVYALHIDGPEESIRCDPYEVATLISQSRVEGSSETTVGWFARLDDCRVDLSAGEHELKLEAVSKDPGYRLERLTVMFLEP